MSTHRTSAIRARHRIGTLRSLFVVAATIAALAALAPATSAASHREMPFHLTKTCASDVLCTITSDSFRGIPPGTDVTYVTDWDHGLTYPTIEVQHGSTTGVCDWNDPHDAVLAQCTFSTGTGRLAGFHLVVDVTVSGDPSAPDSVWHWDGTYWFACEHGPHR